MRKLRIDTGSNNTSTILSITMVLLTFGLLLIIEYHMQRQSFRAQEMLTYKVDLAEDTPDDVAKALTDSISNLPYVKRADYVSKEEAAEIFSGEIGEDFVSFIGYNPLSPTIMVNFWAEWDPEKQSRITDLFCQNIKKNNYVTGVAYQEHVVDTIQTLFRKVTLLLIFFGLLLLIICYLIIRNTVRIAIYAQRNTIQTMRMVGATRSFITRPYVWRSILYGTIAGLLADAILFLTFYIFNHEFSFALLHPHHFPRYATISIALIVIGIILSGLSTTTAVRRYLKKLV
ncbi:MAG: permease-like cell division protein FtsX [Bacteroidales bacterium]|nr:permease-like cell division protein FtsX [Bacteroidales bacterium]